MTDNDDDLTLPPAQDGEPSWAADLRSKFDKRSTQLRDTRTENADLKRRLALAESGVTGLDEDQQTAILASIKGDVTAEAVREKAGKFGWFTPPPDPQAQQEQQADQAAQTQDRVADATSGGQSASSGVIKPGDIAAWTADRWAAFKKANPSAAEALLRGQEVSGQSI